MDDGNTRDLLKDAARRVAMRISLSSPATTDKDGARSLAAILEAHKEVTG